MERKGWVPNAEKHISEKSAAIRQECLDAAKEVAATKFCNWHEMLNGVYEKQPWNLKEQTEELEEHIKKHPDIFPLDEFPQPLTLTENTCLLYTSDAADDTPCVDLGGRRIIKKKKKKY
eukprot:TRINITY_DN1165_c0_g1_i3.p3 TRINITY_DN1165_c0_g1~~TRINITY_DN1165_c0_g1_i3.p3  ORF type:complete len:119 (-),score=36.26 TRINITY_DN1165_c0_g1_i3:55-411(-)